MKTENIEEILAVLKRQSEFCQWDAIPAAYAELAALKADRGKWELALTGLTPGGSEFVGDPERCVNWVRQHKESMKQSMLRFKHRSAEKGIGITGIKKKLRKMLEQCTHEGTDGDTYYFCPVCRANEWDAESIRHLDGCWLGVILKEKAELIEAEEDKEATVPLREETIKEYLDNAIRRWRKQYAAATSVPSERTDIVRAACHISAYQSVRASLFGELLPEEL